MHPEAFERLRHKDTQGAIINRVQQDFNLTPILADAYFQQFFAYFEEFLELPDHEGTLKYIAVRDDQPPGKLLKDCLTVSVMLPLHAPEDLDTRAKLGLAATRQQQILRLTTAAWEQHALLTIEDLAILLCTSESTLKRDLRVLRGQGYAVPTRGYIADIGRTTTHKAMIIRLCLEHDTITPVLAQSKHSLASVERYLKAFCRMVLLFEQGLDDAESARLLGCSQRLAEEYRTLWRLHQDSPHLTELINRFSPSQKNFGGASHETR